MKKLITVSYSITIEIEVPENISDAEIFAADEKRIDICPEQESLVTKILQEASGNIEWRDGAITDIQEAE